MIRLLFRQPVHIWRTLELRHKIEAIILVVLIYAFLGTRLDLFFNKLIENTLSVSGLTLLVANLFTFQISISALLIVNWLLPRQKSLIPFLTKPLSKSDLLKLTGFQVFKYLSIYLILFIPAATALFSALGFVSFFSALLIVIIFSSFFTLLFLNQKQQAKSAPKVILKGLSAILVYHTLFIVFYVWNDYLVLFQIFSFILILFFTINIYYNSNLLTLESFVPYLKKVYVKPEIVLSKKKGIPKLLPGIVQPLFEKEINSLWRNPNYKKLKINGFILFVVLNTLILISNFENKEIWISVITSLLILAHHSNNFNEKYVFTDPTWFIKTLPMRFRHILAAKYFAESGYVILLSTGFFIFLLFCGITFKEQLILLAALFVFSNTVLFVMLNFQIMFFNDPRLAGYSYAFTMLFLIILMLNYSFVGPIIALGLLFFLLYKNVKYFNE